MKIIDKNKDLLELFASLNNHEVFTPPDIANQMLDLLPEKVWSEPQYKFLDPAVKTGVFIREIMFRLFKGLDGKGVIKGFDGKEYDLNNNQERMNHILKNMLFGISTSELTGYMGRRTIYGVMRANSSKENDIVKELLSLQEDNLKDKDNVNISFDNMTVNKYYDETIFDDEEGNIFYPHKEVDEIKKELEEEGKDIFGIEDTFFPFIQENIKHKKIKLIKENKMKFDIIIGNPPYQENTTANDPKQIYIDFIKNSKDLNPKYIIMITPSRWMTDGKGIVKKFKEEMLNDNRLKIINDFKNEKECFPSVEIKGGVNYFLWDSSHFGDCLFSEYKENKPISTVYRKLNKYDIFIRDNKGLLILEKLNILKEPTFSNKVSSRVPFGIQANYSNYKDKVFENSIKLYGNKASIMKKNKGIGYIQKTEVKKNNDLINLYKVLIPKASGTGKDKYILSTPILADKKSVCSDTYLIIDSFTNKIEAENLIKYIKTKFFRFLVSLRKNTQNTTKSTYSFVPILSMTEEWTDEKLYKKYNLTEEEIKYIEENIEEMK